MKTLKMNLTELSVLNEKEMTAIQGGHCVCGCMYVNSGGSSEHNNGCANKAGGLHSPGAGSGGWSASGDYYHR